MSTPAPVLHDEGWCPQPGCGLPQRHMREFIAECDNGHRWDRGRAKRANDLTAVAPARWTGPEPSGTCPICAAPFGFHEEAVHDGPLPPHLAHLARKPASALREERPKGKPSDEEIARRRAAKHAATEPAGTDPEETP